MVEVDEEEDKSKSIIVHCHWTSHHPSEPDAILIGGQVIDHQWSWEVLWEELEGEEFLEKETSFLAETS